MLTEMKKGFSSADLKLFAIIFMLIDHIGAIGIEGYLMEAGYMTPVSFNVLPGMPGYDLAMRLYLLDLPLRLIGRVAFPLFAFMIVQGFLHTHSRRDYLLRLLAFALISQIPFRLAVSLIGLDSRNVYFTLALGLICIWGLELAREKAGSPVMAIPGSLLIIASCCLAAWYLDSDYSQYGVLCIVAFYLLRDRPVLGALAACTILIALSPFFESTTLFSIYFISRYNGQKGSLPFGKYAFYAFYPIHMLIIYGVVRLIMLTTG